MGRGARFWPPSSGRAASGAPSMASTWPEPVSATKPMPERVPAAGLLILRDGEPGEPEVTLSPLRYHYQHRAEIEAVVQGATRDAAFDTLCASIGAALTADRTLGGVCDSISMTDGGTIQLEQSSDATRASVSLGLTVVYRTERGDWSQQIT